MEAGGTKPWIRSALDPYINGGPLDIGPAATDKYAVFIIENPVVSPISYQSGGIIRRSSTQASQTPAAHHPNPVHGSYHWVYERALSVATLGAVGAAFIVPGKSVDMALGVLLPLHSHIGFGAIITDYLPKRKFPRVYLVARTLLYVGTTGVLFGLYQYNTTDVGICEGVRSLWQAKGASGKAAREE